MKPALSGIIGNCCVFTGMWEFIQFFQQLMMDNQTHKNIMFLQNQVLGLLLYQYLICPIQFERLQSELYHFVFFVIEFLNKNWEENETDPKCFVEFKSGISALV